jgi:hypothetical protein
VECHVLVDLGHVRPQRLVQPLPAEGCGLQQHRPAILRMGVTDQQAVLFQPGDQPGQAARGEGELLGQPRAGGASLRMACQPEQDLELEPPRPEASRMTRSDRLPTASVKRRTSPQSTTASSLTRS